jgi:hypothetical protein
VRALARRDDEQDAAGELHHRLTRSEALAELGGRVACLGYGRKCDIRLRAAHRLLVNADQSSREAEATGLPVQREWPLQA